MIAEGIKSEAKGRPDVHDLRLKRSLTLLIQNQNLKTRVYFLFISEAVVIYFLETLSDQIDAFFTKVVGKIVFTMISRKVYTRIIQFFSTDTNKFFD